MHQFRNKYDNDYNYTMWLPVHVYVGKWFDFSAPPLQELITICDTIFWVYLIYAMTWSLDLTRLVPPMVDCSILHLYRETWREVAYSAMDDIFHNKLKPSMFYCQYFNVLH